MILELTQLEVPPGLEPQLIAAVDRVKTEVAARPGFVELTLSRCFEQQNVFLLVVGWEGLADVPRDAGWRRLLADFEDPEREVLHFHRVLDVAERLVAVGS